MKRTPEVHDAQDDASAKAVEQLAMQGNGEDHTEDADDAWLASIRLRQDYAETVGVQKVLLTVPFRKPNKDEFFRVHPEHRLDVTLVEFKTERELFVVLEAVEPALLELATPARLFQCVNRQGTTFVWPAKLPTADRRRNDAWRDSGLDAAALAETRWIRINADMNLGAYQPFQAQMSLGEPQWPSLSFAAILKLALEGSGDRQHGSSGREAASRDGVMGPDPLGRFAEIWCVDFEFIASPGERPDPVCMVARELRSGRVIRAWRDALREMGAPPFPIGEDALYVAYAAAAEFSCHLALGWPLPVYVLDAYVEFLGLINGLPQRFAKGGTSQLGALAYFGLTRSRRRRKQGGVTGSSPARPSRRWRSSGSSTTARPTSTGWRSSCRSSWQGCRRVPIGSTTRSCAAGTSRRWRAWNTWAFRSTCRSSRHLVANWEEIKAALIDQIRAEFPVWDGTTFKHDRFAAWLAANRIPWPRTETERLSLSDDTFKTMVKAYPVVAPIREVRDNLASLRLSDLAVGHDGRNRTGLFPFGTRSSRNAPSNSKFVFGPSAWLRSLIRPGPGMALAYIDYASQEVAVAAALSGDEALQRAYASGDPYMAFAIEAGLAPPEATKQTHEAIRSRCKAVVLGTNYGMQAQTLASRLDMPELEAKQLLRAHRRTYGRFWQWSQAAVDSAMLLGRIDTVFGWRLHVTADTRVTSLLNQPMQSNGAEMLRLACIFATEAGIRVCAPVHDALLIEAPIGRDRRGDREGPVLHGAGEPHRPGRADDRDQCRQDRPVSGPVHGRARRPGVGARLRAARKAGSVKGLLKRKSIPGYSPKTEDYPGIVFHLSIPVPVFFYFMYFVIYI